MLEGDPIELAKMILALGDLCSVPFSDGLSLRSGAVSIFDDLSEPVRVGSAAPWRSARGKREKPLCPRIFLRAACNQSWPRLDPGLIMTVTLGSRDT